MLKKILFSLLLVLSLGVQQSALAQDPPQPLGTSPSGNIDSAGFTFDLNPITHSGIEGSVKQNWIRNGANYFFERIIGFLAGVAGSIAILIMSYGGFLILSSAGSQEQYEKGIGYIKYALIGLTAALGAYILVNLTQILVRSIYG